MRPSYSDCCCHLYREITKTRSGGSAIADWLHIAPSSSDKNPVETRGNGVDDKRRRGNRDLVATLNVDQETKQFRILLDQLASQNGTLTLELGRRFPTDQQEQSSSSSSSSESRNSFNVTETCCKQLRHLFNSMSSFRRSVRLVLNFCDLKNKQISSLIALASKRRLLSELDVHVFVDDHEYWRDLVQISRCVKWNSNLTSLDCTFLVDKGIQTRPRLPRDFIDALKATTTLRNLSLTLDRGFDQELELDIVEFISANKSIESLTLRMGWQSLSQFEVFLMFLLKHPFITELKFRGDEIRGTDSFAFDCVPAICRFLSSRGCKISSFCYSGVRNRYNKYQLHDMILSSLWDGHPMRHIDLSGNGDDSPQFPNFLTRQNNTTRQLETIDFSCNNYILTGQERSTVNASWSLRALLDKCPKLFEVKGYSSVWENCPNRNTLKYMLDRNLVNRLMGENEDIVLGLWPVLIGTINCKLQPSTKRQADQIFRLLIRGGVFLFAHAKEQNSHRLEQQKLRIQTVKKSSDVLTSSQHHRHLYKNGQSEIKDTNISTTMTQKHDTNTLKIVQHTRAGRQFEIVCYTSKLFEYYGTGSGGTMKLHDILETRRIFLDAKKHVLAPSDILEKTFGTRNELNIARQILEEGNQHTGIDRLEKKTEKKLIEIAEWISKNCCKKKKCDPTTSTTTPAGSFLSEITNSTYDDDDDDDDENENDDDENYSAETIRTAMNKVAFKVHLTKPASQQYEECLEVLEDVLPMIRKKIEISMSVPFGEHVLLEAFFDDHDIEWQIVRTAETTSRRGGDGKRTSYKKSNCCYKLKVDEREYRIVDKHARKGLGTIRGRAK